MRVRGWWAGMIWLGVGLGASGAGAADKWNVAFFHDEQDSALTLGEIVFPSERRGLALGVLNEQGRLKPVVVVTGDGGKRWEMVPVKEIPVTVSCVSDAACWMATEGGVWFTEEAGRSWRKVSRQKGILAMHFDSATHGFAGGVKKTIWETKDGGKTWTPIAATKEIAAKEEFAAFHTMGFGGRTGIIAGTSRPPRRDDMSLLPPWMEPEQAAKRREWPNLMLMAETRDGGGTWKVSSASIFGRVSRIAVDPAGFAVVLLQFGDTFEIPAEVGQIDFKTGRLVPVYRDKQHAVTDVAYLANRSIVAAGTEPTGLRSLRLPGRVVIREAKIRDVTQVGAFEEQAVDYRAVARQVKLAVAPEGQLWAATDTGMILRLDRGAMGVR